MDSLLSVDPGAIIWTIVNFLIFLLIVSKLGSKAITKALKDRETKITQDIEDAEKTNQEAKKYLDDAHKKIESAQKEMGEIVAKGRQQAEKIIQDASDEANQIKKKKLDEAVGEIDRQKEIAIKELRSEVADLVVQAAEKILEEKLDKEKHYKMVESYIEKLEKN